MSRLPALASVIGWPILSLLLVALLLGGCNQNRAVIIDATPEDQAAARQVNAVNATPTLNRQSYALSTAVPVNMGSSTNPFGLLLGADGIAQVTEALLEAGFIETEIRAVMGENARRFLLANLPPSR